MTAALDNAQPISEASFRQALDLVWEGVLLIDAIDDTARIRYANSQFTRLSGFTPEELFDMTWQDICRDVCVADVAESLRRERSFCSTVLMERADGTRRRAGVRVRALLDEQGDSANWFVQFMPSEFLDSGDSDPLSLWLESDATVTRNRFSRLDRIDGSSGLLRFERFRDFLDRDFALAAREAKTATVILFRILEFDQYRCTFGVNAADACLRTVGKQVTAALRRSTDLCARLGDDTIIAAVFGRTADDGARLARQISENVDGLRIHNPRGRQGRFIGLSSAVACCDAAASECSVDSLLESARFDLDRVTAQTMTA